ncbi:MAG: hypothetical protein AAB874_00195 [Patescibacteria group bacterium]
MDISPDQWQNSSIPRFFDIFTGFVGEILQQMPVENTEKFSSFLTPIFWRWYFTRLSSSDDISPVAKVEYFHTIEDWPDKTMFFAKPAISTDKMSATVELDIELVSFYEQPLLDSLFKNESMTYFISDRFYKELLSQIQISSKNEGLADITSTKELITFWSILITNLISHWWGNDPFISNTFSLKQFVSLLEQFLKQIHRTGERGVTPDEIFDVIISLVRKKFPGWSMTGKELEQLEKERILQKEVPRSYETMSEKSMKRDAFFHMGTLFDLYFVTPLSQYMLLLEPYYMEIGDFRQEIVEIASDPKGDPRFILAKPPGSIRLTPFGKQLFSLIFS